MRRQSVNHGADIAVDKTIQIVTGKVDAVIGYSSLRKIIGTDTFRAVSAAHLTFAYLRLSRYASALRHPGVWLVNFHGLVLVLSCDFSS